MTTTVQQIPGALNIEVGLGDDWSYLLDFDVSLSGYTFDAKVVYISNNTETSLSMSVANTDLANGQITLSLTDTQITTIGTGAQNKWYLIWTTGSTSRRILAGTFKVIAYP